MTAVMRRLTRKEEASMHALEHAIEAEPVLGRVLVSDYAHTRAHVHDLRGLLARRLTALAGHVDEPGSRSELAPRTILSENGADGLSPYGTEDTTGFAPGSVY